MGISGKKLHCSIQGTPFLKLMQVEAKNQKAFEEYEMYEEMRNGIKVRAKVSNVERERSKEIELIADTDAIYSAIPEDIVARGKRRFKTASGELKELPVGEAYMEIAGEGVNFYCCITSKRCNTPSWRHNA